MKPHRTRPFSLLTSRPPLWLGLSLALLLMLQPALVMAAQLPPAAPGASDADLPPELQEALRRAEELTIDETAISVEARAEAIGGDIADLFAFVRDEIRFEPYRFLLRGPEGTLVAGAGNSVDQAYLLEALCRHHDLRCRVVQGTLTDEQAGELIASLFSGPVPEELLEGIPEDAPKVDPTRDPVLLAEVKEHYWVQYFDEASRTWTDLDPAASLPPGKVMSEAGRIVSEALEELSPRLSLTVHLEEIRDGKAIRSTPLRLDESWSSLVLKPVHLVNVFDRMRKPDGITVTAFQPLLMVDQQIIQGEVSGKKAETPGTAGLMGRTADVLQAAGEGPQEVEPLGLSREWIEFTLRYPSGRSERWSYEVFTEVEDISRWATILISLDFSGGAINEHFLDARFQEFIQAQALAQRSTAVLDLPTLLAKEPPEDLKPYERGAADVLTAMMAANRRLAATHALSSDRLLDSIRTDNAVMAYRAEARALITSTALGERGVQRSLDLSRNRVRFLLPPGTPAALRPLLHVVRGAGENSLEAKVLETLTGSQNVGALAVLRAAKSQGIPFVVFSPDTETNIGDFDYSELAQRKISEAIDSGQIIIAPERMVGLEDGVALAWWEVDSETGEFVATYQDGGHKTVIEYILVTSFVGAVVTFVWFYLVGVLGGFLAGAVGSMTYVQAYEDKSPTPCGDACEEAIWLCNKFYFWSDGYFKTTGYLRQPFQTALTDPLDPGITPLEKCYWKAAQMIRKWPMVLGNPMGPQTPCVC